MHDLFADHPHDIEVLPMQDADVWYSRGFLMERESEVLRRLIDETLWRQESIVVWGKRHLQPRLIAWYGDSEATYTYSGLRLDPVPWTGLLDEIRQRVEAAARTRFNSVLLNYYRDNRDSMGFHSDDEPELGPRPVIASLSFGEERTFVLRHRFNAQLLPLKLQLASGSLLVMKGATQRCWEHGAPKAARACGPRVNLTFRHVSNTGNTGKGRAA